MSDVDQVNLKPGTMVAGFRIEGFVGAGAMAVVYRAVQVNLERPVALKILPRDFSRSRDYVDRFFNEARAAAAFSHPNIVRAYDAGIDDNDVCYFAMEFVEGETVFDRIVREHHLPILDGLQIALRIAEALEYGWREHRLTHGDIKPANLMVNDKGEIKLADFGLAKVAEIEDVSGSVMLTPLYASPEVIQGYQTKEDCRPDIYSFGATLYHMLGGAPPFPGDDSKEVMRLQVEAALVPLYKLNPAVPRNVSDFVSSLLLKEPDKRVQTWSDVVVGLREVIGFLTRKGTTAVATVAMVDPVRRPATIKRPRSVHAIRTHAKRSLRKAGALKMLLGGSLLGLVVLAAVIVVLLLDSGGGRVPAPEPVAPPADDPGHPPPPEPVATASELWRELNALLAAETEIEKRLETLARFGRKFTRREDELRIRRMIDRETMKLAEHRRRLAELAAGHQSAEAHPEPPPKAPPGLSPDELAALAREQADAYTHVIHAAVDYQLSFVTTPDVLLAGADHWLQRHPGENEYAARVRFLRETVIPSLARLRSLLIADQESLKGMQIPGREDLVRGFENAGVATTVPLSGGVGKVERSFSWSDVSQPPVVKAFARKLIAKPAPSHDELRAALSCMLFDGAVSAVETRVGSLPGEEARMWMLLTRDVAAAPAEKEALERLAAARRAVQRRAYLAAHVMLQGLQARPTTVRVRHADEIARLQETVAPHTPERRLQEIRQQASVLAVPNPQRALALIVDGLAKYGQEGGVEATELRALAKRVVEQIATEVEASEPRDEFWREYRPYLYPSQAHLGRSLGVLQLFRRQNRLPAEVVANEAAFEGLSWIDVGDWQAGAETFDNLARHRHLGIPQSTQFLFAYGDALLTARFNGVGELLDQHLADLHRLATGERLNPNHAALALQFAIANDRFHAADRFRWPELDEFRFSRGGIPPYAISLIALKLSAGDLSGAIEICRKSKALMLAFEESEDSPPVAVEGARLLRWLTERFGAEPEDSQDGDTRWPPFQPLVGNPAGRWILHVLVTENRIAAGERAMIVRALADKPTLVSPLDAKRAFEGLLIELESLIGNRQLAEAEAKADAFLLRPLPILNHYYPRALAIKAGILMLDKQLEPVRETLTRVTMSTVASPHEAKWAAYFDRPMGDRVSKVKPGEPRLVEDFAFWDAWLNFCHWQAVGHSAFADREVKLMYRLTNSPIKKRFAESMLRWSGEASEKK